MKKERFVILDALRAIAGLTVPLFHIFENLGRLPAKYESWCGHGYLAVEFFLLLMGYMLAYAYDRRWEEGMSLWGFFRRRLVRLHPLVVSGVLLGLVVYFLQGAFGATWLGRWSATMPAWQVLLYALWAMTMVPVVGCGGMINPFNACSWTLYYQYLGNILYALVVRHMRSWMLAVAAALSAVAMAVFVFHPDLNALFGTQSEYLAHLARRSTSFDGGWGMDDMQYTAGLVRLAFPLFFGLLIFRLGWKIRLPKAVATVLVPLVFVAFMFVPAGEGSLFALSSVWNGVLELAFVFLFLPFILLVGIGSDAPGGRFAQVADFFGRLSFPVYMSHFMFLPIHRYYVVQYSAKVSFASRPTK